MFEIPVVFARIRKGANHIFIDHTRLPYYLNLHKSDMIALREVGLIQQKAQVKMPRLRIDYLSLAQEYRVRLESGEFSRCSDLARSLGVSRAWVSKVLNRTGEI